MDPLIVTSVMDSIRDCLLVLDEEGRVICSNKMSEEILGFSHGELEGRNVARVLCSHDPNREMRDLFVETVDRKALNSYREVDYNHPDGSVRRLAVTTSYLISDEEDRSTFLGFVALLKDITELFLLRRNRDRIEREKERISREKIRTLNRLAMRLAHEIRNPVVTIAGFALRISRAMGNSESTRRYAQNILHDARRLEQVVDEIQNYCDLPPVRPVQGDLAAVVADAVTSMEKRADERGITVSFHDDLRLEHSIYFDPILLKKAVAALLENAIDFSPDGSAVEVCLYCGQSGTTIQVADQGAGIDRKDLQFVFDPFFSTRTHGAGMGLPLVERVAHDHLGRVEINSAPGKGTTVRLILPDVCIGLTPAECTGLEEAAAGI